MDFVLVGKRKLGRSFLWLVIQYCWVFLEKWIQKTLLLMLSSAQHLRTLQQEWAVCMSDNNADYVLLSGLQANQEEKRSSFFSVNFIYNYPKVLVTFSGDGTQQYCFGYPLEQISKWRCFILLYISAVVVLSLSSLLFFLLPLPNKRKNKSFSF